MTTKIARRELLQLAHTYKPEKMDVGGWMISEKLDGSRCFWDGGATRGMATKDVPWAGLTHPKKLTPKDKIKPYSTGLWSRYGNPIIAPDWFLDELPSIPMDGELWCGRGNFQTSRSICSGDTADDRWADVTYMVYGCPPMSAFTSPGLIKNVSMYCEVPEECLDFIMTSGIQFLYPNATFEDEYEGLQELVSPCVDSIVRVHTQTKLSAVAAEAKVEIEAFMLDVITQGGEGAVIRDPKAKYICKRTRNLLKYKPYEDDDGVLVGFTAGKGKYEGMIGALILDYNGKRLELSGMTDKERGLKPHVFETVPGKDLHGFTQAIMFERGQKISFKFRELSDAGVPKEARYFRQRGDM